MQQQFPDVFATVLGQDLQLSSFYSASGKSVKPAQGVSKRVSESTIIQTLEVHPPAPLPPLSPQLQLPPMRRVVKLLVTPHATVSLLVAVAILNMVIWVLELTKSEVTRNSEVTDAALVLEVTRLQGSLWGTFVYLWLLVTLIQLCSHAVYLYTPTDICISGMHLGLVVCTVLLPRHLFTQWEFLAPLICAVLAVYQGKMFCLVYAHVKRRRVFYGCGLVLTVIPLIQLIRVDSSIDSMSHLTWSAISVGVLYGFALINSRGAVVVDLTIGTSPLVAD
jgi:hypothetical protein